MGLLEAIAAMAGGGRKGYVDLSDAFTVFTRETKIASAVIGDKYSNILKEQFNLIAPDDIVPILNKVASSEPIKVSRFVEYILKESPEVFKSYDEYSFSVKKFDRTPIVKINIYNGKALSEISEFNHTDRSRDDRMDGDTVLFSKRNTIAIHKVKLSNAVGWAYDEYTVCFNTIMDYENLTEYPQGIDYRTPLTLNTGHIDHHVTCEGDVAEIIVNGDSSITSWMPINVTNCKKLVIKGKGGLKILASKDYQPVIGCYTNVDYRMDKCELGPSIDCEEIVIDGVDVTLKGKEPNFTIGRYGTNDMIKITCINGGQINCPETKGTRVCSKGGSIEETNYSIK